VGTVHGGSCAAARGKATREIAIVVIRIKVIAVFVLFSGGFALFLRIFIDMSYDSPQFAWDSGVPVENL
jgi:hypothetical protein